MLIRDAQIKSLIKKFQGEMIPDDTDRKNISAIEALWTDYKSIPAPVYELSRANETDEAMLLLNRDPTGNLSARCKKTANMG